MADKIAENKSDTDLIANWQDLPILQRDPDGKYHSPLSPNIHKLRIRINGDGRSTATEIEGMGIFGQNVGTSVDQILEGAEQILKKSAIFEPINDDDLRKLATYLDWSHMKQTGVTANQTTKETALKESLGAKDVWVLFTSIKNKLEK